MLASLVRSFLLTIPPVRARAERLWQLEREVGTLQDKLDRLEAEGSADNSRHYPMRMLHRPMAHLHPGVRVRRVGRIDPPDDGRIVSRVLAAYRLAAAKERDLGDSMWKTFFSRKHQALHELFVAGSVEDAARVLRDPGSSELFYGFSMLCAGLYDANARDPELHAGARQYLDWLACLAEHLGALRIANPENGRPNVPLDADDLLAQLDVAFGIELPIPNPYPGEAGLGTARGVLTDRIPMALYQAWRTRQLVARQPAPRVVEIGAGQGLAAYYSRLLGVEDYTIVDIPFTGLSSGYFLLRTLGEDGVTLFGESHALAPRTIKVLPPRAFLEADLGRFDLAVNVDSLTEMDAQVAHAYLTKASAIARVVLSINHETNAHTVREWVGRNAHASYERVPCYIRRGYVEEIVRFA